MAPIRQPDIADFQRNQGLTRATLVDGGVDTSPLPRTRRTATAAARARRKCRSPRLPAGPAARRTRPPARVIEYPAHPPHTTPVVRLGVCSTDVYDAIERRLQENGLGTKAPGRFRPWRSIRPRRRQREAMERTTSCSTRRRRTARKRATRSAGSPTNRPQTSPPQSRTSHRSLSRTERMQTSTSELVPGQHRIGPGATLQPFRRHRRPAARV